MIVSLLLLAIISLLPSVPIIVPSPIVANSLGVEFLQNALRAISFTTPYQNFAVGIIKLSDVVFFLSVPVLFIFFTIKVLERRRWN